MRTQPRTLRYLAEKYGTTYSTALDIASSNVRSIARTAVSDKPRLCCSSRRISPPEEYLPPYPVSFRTLRPEKLHVK